MESPQVIRFCVRQLTNASGPARRNTSDLCNRTLQSQSYIKSNTKSARRSFTTSIRSQQDSASPTSTDTFTSQSTNPTQDAAAPQAPRTQASQPSTPRNSNPAYRTQDSPYARPQRPVRPVSDEAIDLSTIRGIGANYAAPPKREDPETAAAKLTALLARSKNHPSSQQQKQQPNSPPSSTEFYAAFNKTLPTASNPNPLGFNDLMSMISPISELTADTMSKTSSSSSNPALALRLRPTLGRTQNVNPAAGIDLTRAFQNLDRKCANNRVRADENAQRFHVRRGQKKKLDRSRRWRVVFKQGFLEECKRVRRMMRQGW